jgi:hypothetical protein
MMKSYDTCAREQQEMLLKYCLENGAKVVFTNNISRLCFGMKKNEANSWKKVGSWELRFQRARSGHYHPPSQLTGTEIRGTSRRENGAFWVVRMCHGHGLIEMRIERIFASEFIKNRNDSGNQEKSLDWTFVTNNSHPANTEFETVLEQ